MKHVVVAQDWFIYQLTERSKVLCGVCFGHPKIMDGHHFRSSVIIDVREEEVETLHTVYKLGLRSGGLSDYWLDQGATPEFVVGLT